MRLLIVAVGYPTDQARAVEVCVSKAVGYWFARDRQEAADIFFGKDCSYDGLMICDGTKEDLPEPQFMGRRSIELAGDSSWSSWQGAIKMLVDRIRKDRTVKKAA